ncbi:helix-turn-helix transcriptional regulator [Algicola sagamiensis]|uniref:helix-turn-helix transcriptional regulator n=1 Tax=Algicola sagamiensis TaxID=163869 RepID=UPI0004766738|nr:YafY family protein [Algicola sagamiensis]
MSRSQRLFDLLQLLRCHKYPVPAESLAQSLNVSTRTIYRDIATLQAQGAEIEGATGLGYIMKPTFTLPPLTLTTAELEVLVLGANWMAKQAEGRFSDAAQNAIAKISAVLPEYHNIKHQEQVMHIPSILEVPECPHLSEITQSIQSQHKAKITYLDKKDQHTTRIIWPILIGLFQQCYVLTAWCENRNAFRHFRLDRIQQYSLTHQKYPCHRRELLKDWRSQQGIKAEELRY